MKDGLRFVDCDMHIMEPPDLFEKYLDPKFKARVLLSTGADGHPRRGMIVIDGLPLSMDTELQQYRKRSRSSATRSDSTQPLSGSRIAASGRLDFAIARNYNAEAQVMGMDIEGIDIAVLFPTTGLSLIARDQMEPQLSLALCQAYNNWIYEFCQYSPDRHDHRRCIRVPSHTPGRLPGSAEFVGPWSADAHRVGLPAIP